MSERKVESISKQQLSENNKNKNYRQQHIRNIGINSNLNKENANEQSISFVEEELNSSCLKNFKNQKQSKLRENEITPGEDIVL